MALPDPTALYLARLGTDHSRATVRSALTTLARQLGATDPSSVNWSSLTSGDLVRVHAGLSGYSPAWANALLSTLRQWVRLAALVGRVDGALAVTVDSLPRFRGGGGRLGGDLDTDDITLLWAAASDHDVRSQRDRALLALLSGALRRSECASIEAGDWDANRRLLTVRHGKGRQMRVVPIARSASVAIDDWLAVHPGTDSMLRSIDRWGHIGDGLSPRAVHGIVIRLCTAVGIDAVSPHSFRAQRLTEVIAASGLPLGRLLAGHSDLRTTAAYDRRGVDELRTVVDDLDRPVTPALRAVS